MNDKERILMTIISHFYNTQMTVPGAYTERYNDDAFGGCTHFAPWKEEKLRKGDLVLYQTSRVNDFKVGFIHSVLGNDRCIIREIGSKRLCDYSNERFVPIVGLSEIELLEGPQQQFYYKVLKAFARGDEYIYRFGGIDFDNKNEATVWIREIFDGYPASKSGTKPFGVKIKWNKNTSIKYILQTLRDGGYGTHKFELLGEPRTIKPAKLTV